MSGMEADLAPPATLDLSASEEPGRNNDKRFLFSESGSRRDVWVVQGRQISKTTVLLTLCGLLLLISGLLAIWCGILRQHQSGGLTASRNECQTAACLEQAAQVAGYINSSAAPCEDFYSYACGRFDNVHPLGIQISYGIADVLEDANKVKIEELLERKEFHNDQSAISKTRTFYRTCMSSFNGNSSSKSLTDLITSLGGMDLLNNFNADEWHFLDLFLTTRELHRLRLFFSITWLQTANRVLINLPRLGMKDPSVYTGNDPSNNQRMALYKQSIITVASLILDENRGDKEANETCDEVCVETLADDVIRIETGMAKIMPRLNDVLPSASNVISFTDLSSVGSQFKWRRLLDNLFGKDVISVSSTVQVPSKDYILELNKLIKSSNASELNNYIMWSLIRQYLPAMGPIFSIMSEELDYITNEEEIKSRQEVCFNLLRKFFPRSLRALFIRGHIGEENVSAAQRLMVKIREILASSFSWMTEETRKTSLEVLNRLQVDYGHSLWITDTTRLNQYYNDLTLNPSNFFTNMMNVHSFKASELKANAARLANDDEEDDDIWVSGDAPDVKVVYNPVRGSLKVPAGGLQVPLFSKDNPDYVNVAGLGSMVLKELAKPFYVRHRTYRTSDWWDAETTGKYLQYKTCLMENFRNYNVQVERGFHFSTDGKEGIHSKSVVRMDPLKSSDYLESEHVAFLLAHQLFQDLSKGQQHSMLPGTQEETPEQLFFLLYTQSRCQSTNRYLRVLLNSAFKTFPHQEMVNNFLYNAPAFMKAFKCETKPREHAGRECALQ